MTYPCPRCCQPIPLEDIHVAKDLALCRRCGRTSSFAEAVQNLAVTAINLNQPAEGAWLREEPGFLEAGATTRSKAAWFLIPFTLLWSGLSVGLIYGKQIVSGHFSLEDSLFGLPFLLGSGVLVSLCLLTTLGCVTVRVSQGQGVIFTGVLGLGWRRRFRAADLTAIRFGISSWTQNGQPARQIHLETPAKILKFGSGLGQTQQDFMVAALRSRLSKA